VIAGTDRQPAIVITRGDPARGPAGERAAQITEQYASAIARAGGEPAVVFASSDRAARDAAFQRMAGLLLAGGADLDPAVYGQPSRAARDVEPARDDLELAAWEAARARTLPVLGICRGLQAINVFSGGGLTQDLGGHDGPLPGHGRPLMHRLRIGSGTQLARILRPTNPGTFVVQVNSSHHQAVAPNDLAATLVPSGWSPGPGGEIVEALEGKDPSWFVLGVQCHPERTESSPPEFERLFRFFVDAARHATRLATRST
jgi:gamma-glutamyl-gamma-aminobutyrate hydrolase PuuD